MNIYVWQDIPVKTFTISWTEASDMSSGWTYSDDAAGLTAGSSDFDDFFWYSAVKLASDGTESSIVSQNAGVLDITQLWTLTSWDNVMIKFPVRWIKMTKYWSTVTLSITDWIGRESEWYQYYAFQDTWDIEANASTTVATKPLYLWAYLSYLYSGAYRSWSWKTPQWNDLIWNAITYGKANGTWWNIMWWYQRQLITAYYMMKYWNPNSQQTVGKGYVNWSSPCPTWWTNSQIRATYWTSSKTTQVKLFWLEDFRWNQTQWIWWAFFINSNLFVALHDFTDSQSTSESQYKRVWWPYSFWNSWWPTITSIVWDNKWMLCPSSSVKNTYYNTYYCEYTWTPSDFIWVGEYYASNMRYNTWAIFYFSSGYRKQYDTGNHIGSRLMYL